MKKKTTKPETPQEQADRIAREQAIFQMACKRHGMTASTGPKIFHISRPTFWAWMAGKHKIPPTAFVRIVELDNQMPVEQWQRIQAMKELSDKTGLALFRKPPKRKPRKAKTQTDKE
jgi:hypothetical protein